MSLHTENIEYMAIENPFVFGKAAEGIYFTDRTEDAKLKKRMST